MSADISGRVKDVSEAAHLASTVKISAALTNRLLSSINVAPPIYLSISHQPIVPLP